MTSATEPFSTFGPSGESEYGSKRLPAAGVQRLVGGGVSMKSVQYFPESEVHQLVVQGARNPCSVSTAGLPLASASPSSLPTLQRLLLRTDAGCVDAARRP